MEFINLAQDNKKEIGKDAIERTLILLAPFTPHLSEELWQRLGHKQSIFSEKWPKYNKKLIKEETITLIVQINGKVRDKIEVQANISEKEAQELTLKREKVKKWILDKKVKKVIFVKNKLINIVI